MGTLGLSSGQQQNRQVDTREVIRSHDGGLIELNNIIRRHGWCLGHMGIVTWPRWRLRLNGLLRSRLDVGIELIWLHMQKKGEEEGGARKIFISAFWAFLHNTLIRLFEGFN